MCCFFIWYVYHQVRFDAGTHSRQTWSTLVLSHSPLKVEVLGTLGIRAIFFLVPSLLFLLFDTIIPSLAVGIKTQGEAALPTRTLRGRRRKGIPKWYTVVGLSLFNICFTTAIQAGIELLFTEVLNIRSVLKVTTTLPMPWSIAKDCIKGLLLREVSRNFLQLEIHFSSRTRGVSQEVCHSPTS